MQLTLISDQHGWLPQLPPCDLLIVAGDLCPIDDHRLEVQRAWLDGPFRSWLQEQPAQRIVGICGNHDFVGQDRAGQQLLRALPWTYLQDEGVVIDGLQLWGSPWAPGCGRWAFMASETELEEYCSWIPDGVDLLVTHGPACGILDRVSSGQVVGSTSLRQRVTRLQPALHVCGHIHEARGRVELPGSVRVNASLLDRQYQPWGRCWTAELQPGPRGWQVQALDEVPLTLERFPRELL